jgi:cytosine permease
MSQPSEPPDALPWTRGVAPRYIALYLLIVYFDQLAVSTLPVGGLAPAALGTTVGGVLAFLLLFYPPAILGWKSRRPLEGVAQGAFGVRGALWVPGVLLGLAQVLWFAVTLYYAVDLALRALATLGLIDAGHLDVWNVGGLRLAGPLFLWVALAWAIASAVIGTVAFRLTAAVMAGYQAFPAIALGLVMLWAIRGAPAFVPSGIDPASGEAAAKPWTFSFVMALQHVFAFSATFGAMAADWGAASRRADDVRLGGFVGVALASTVLGTLALLTVAGALGGHGGQGPGDFTVRHALQRELAGPPGGVALIVLNLALLGPACFTPFVIGRRFHEAFPRVPRAGWSLIGAVATLPLIAFRIPARLGPVFAVLGALFAPVVGALAADAARGGGAWPGPRRGVNLAGLVAWAVGLGVGLVPVVGPGLGLADAAFFQPAALLAFASAFVTYFALAIAGLVPPTLPSAETPGGPSADGEAVVAPAPGPVVQPSPTDVATGRD